jgi:hypothetical protein
MTDTFELEDRDTLIVLRPDLDAEGKMIPNTLTIVSCGVESKFESPAISMTALLLTLVPNYLATYPEEREKLMKFIYEKHSDVLENFLTRHVFDNEN